METTINIWILLFFAFAIQSFVLAILFFIKRKGDRLANTILGVYLLLFTYNLLFNCAYWSNCIQTKPFLFLLYTNYIPWILYGPLLYIYLRRIVFKTALTHRDWIHFVPLLIIFIKCGRFMALSADTKIEVYANNTWADYIHFEILPKEYTIWFVVSVMLFYLCLMYRIYRKVKARRTQEDSLKLVWIKYLMGSYSGYVLIFITCFVLVYLNMITPARDYIIGYFLIFFVSVVAYFSFMQPDIFSGKIKILNIKYKNNGLPSSYAMEMKDKLIRLMESDKLYLDNSLTLDALSERLDLSRHHTSQLINEYFNVNFFEFVNNYRVKEAILLLEDGENKLNINQIVYTSGFNNRTSFYNAFKKKTGVSPKLYRNKSL